MKPAPKNILVIRNDKLGDFMLAWPAFALLKKQFPEARVTTLVPEYTRPLAELCPWLDAIITDDLHTTTFSDARHLATVFKNGHFDAAVLLFSDVRTALALWLANVPVRIAPATKLAQIFINHKLVQRRSRSAKPEALYNIELVQELARIYEREPVDAQEPPYLVFDSNEITNLRQAYCEQSGINTTSKLIIVHPGHGGSASNLSVQQYADLIKRIADPNMHFIITAGPGESEIAMQLHDSLHGLQRSIYHSEQGLVSFAKFLSVCDLFISGSTGPLHLAGALNVATAAFYPNRRSATALRWQTINQSEYRLAFSPENNSDTMESVDLIQAASTIKQFISKTH